MGLRDLIARWLERFEKPVEAETVYYDVRGFEVALENPREDIDTDFVLRRLDAALELIEHWSPWRMAHIRRDVRQLWVIVWPCRGAYFPEQRAIMTELTFLARHREFTVAQVASSILHEGVHARIHRMGVRAESLDRAREERICRRAELAFGQRLPPVLGAPVVARAAATLEASDADIAPEIDWEEAHRRKAEADAADRARARRAD